MPKLGSLWNVTHIYCPTSFGEILEVERIWFNSKIVWVPKREEEKYLIITPNELYLWKENNYTDKFNIESNTTWEIT